MDQAEERWRCTSTPSRTTRVSFWLIELLKSGKVLLFAADAQTGNWLSWADVKWQRTA